MGARVVSNYVAAFSAKALSVATFKFLGASFVLKRFYSEIGSQLFLFCLRLIFFGIHYYALKVNGILCILVDEVSFVCHQGYFDMAVRVFSDLLQPLSKVEE